MIALNRRRVMGGIGQPYDAQIEYLESTGTQYIDTGISPTQDVGFWLDALLLGSNATKGANVGCFGSGNAAWVQALQLYGKLNGHSLATTPFVVGNRQYFNVHISYDNRFQISFINGVLTDAQGGTRTISTFYVYSGNLYLFGTNFEGSMNLGADAKIYGLKIYKGSNVVLDFIPVRVGTVGYMYDRVSKQLFGNSGTGNFILGGDV